jgi:hypothetical protein
VQCGLSVLVWIQADEDDSQRQPGLVHRERNLRKVKLDRLSLANYAQSPEKQAMGESFGHWNFSIDYLDETASPEQRAALEAIAAVILPSTRASQNFKTEYASRTREVEGKEHRIAIGEIASFNGHFLEGGVSRITNPPGADPLDHQYTQGATSKMVYRGLEQNWNWTGSNYMFVPFNIDSAQYANYAADTAQKKRAAEKP